MKILIIDDEITALTKLKAILSDYGDCIMTTHADQGLRLFQTAIENQTPFGLVCIDIQLSQASGLDLLATMIQMEIQSKACHALKIVVSASGTKANLVKAYTRGCDGFLVKPVKRDVLIEKLDALGIQKQQEATGQESPPVMQPDGVAAVEDLPAAAPALADDEESQSPSDDPALTGAQSEP